MDEESYNRRLEIWYLISSLVLAVQIWSPWDFFSSFNESELRELRQRNDRLLEQNYDLQEKINFHRNMPIPEVWPGINYSDKRASQC